MQRRLTKLCVSKVTLKDFQKRNTGCKQINSSYNDIEPRQADREPLRSSRILWWVKRAVGYKRNIVVLR